VPLRVFPFRMACFYMVPMRKKVHEHGDGSRVDECTSWGLFLYGGTQDVPKVDWISCW
jgi:hypothetical protein